MMKRSTFIGSVNKLMANFGYLQASVLSNIFKTCCCNFYGSPIWDFNSPGCRRICTTWNIGVRTAFIPFNTHAYVLRALLRQNHIRQQLQVRSITISYNMYHSKNAIVRSCFNHAILDANSCFFFYFLFFHKFFIRTYQKTPIVQY